VYLLDSIARGAGAADNKDNRYKNGEDEGLLMSERTVLDDEELGLTELEDSSSEDESRLKSNR
jgi:hypothetical protein